MNILKEFICMSPVYVEKIKREMPCEDYCAGSEDTLEKWIKENSLMQGRDGFYLFDDGKNRCGVSFSRESIFNKEEKAYRNKVTIYISSSCDCVPDSLSEKLRDEGYLLVNYPLSDENG